MCARPALLISSLCLAALSLESVHGQSVRTDLYGDALPPGAVARMGSLLFYHGLTPTTFAFSPDGKILAVSNRGIGDPTQPRGIIRLLDTATGRQFRQLSGYESVRMLRFTPDGKQLIARDTKDFVKSSITISDVTTGKELYRRAGHDTTRDGKTLLALSVGRDSSTVRFVDVSSNKEIRRILLPAGNVGYLVSAPDDKSIAGHAGGSLLVWDAATGNERYRLVMNQWTADEPAFSPNGNLLAARFQDGTVLVLDASSGRERHRWNGAPGFTGNPVAFSPDSKTLAVPWKDKTIRLWDVETGEETHRIEPPTPKFGSLSSIFSPDGKSLLWGIQADGLAGKQVHRWDLVAGKDRPAPGRLPTSIESLAFSPDAQTLQTLTTSQSSLILWDVRTGKARDLREFVIPKRSYTAHLVPSGAYWARRVRKAKHPLKDAGGPGEVALQGLASEYVLYECLSPDGRLLALAGHDEIRVWDWNTGKKLVSSREIAGHLLSLAFVEDGKTLLGRVHGPTGWLVQSWDAVSGKPLASLKAPAPSVFDPLENRLMPFFNQPTVFSPDGRFLSSIVHEEDSVRGRQEKRSIQIWNLAAGKEIHRMRAEENPIQLAYSPDGRSLACAYEQNVIRLWETATGQERRRFHGHRGKIGCLAFSSDGKLLATGADDCTALVWDLCDENNYGPVGNSNFTDAQLQSLWLELKAKDAAVAYRAACRMLAGRQTMGLLRRQLRPASLETNQREQLQRWIADLDSSEFAVREKAFAELEKRGELAEPLLRAAVADKPSLETRQRLTLLLERLEAIPSSEKLEVARALEILERAGSPEAIEVLKSLADGLAGARLTRQVKASLDRISRR